MTVDAGFLARSFDRDFSQRALINLEQRIHSNFLHMQHITGKVAVASSICVEQLSLERGKIGGEIL